MKEHCVADGVILKVKSRFENTYLQHSNKAQDLRFVLANQLRVKCHVTNRKAK